MKSIVIKKAGLAILGMLVFGIALASEPVIKVVGPQKFILRMDNVAENSNLVVKDINGLAIYSKTIEKSNKPYQKIFDLSILPDGNYVVEWEGSVKVTSFDIALINSKIIKTEICKKETYKPLFVERGKRIRILMHNPDNSYLNVAIFNNENDMVFEEKLAGKVELGRIYDFSNVKGQFKIAMSSGNKTYVKEISIN